VVTYQTEENT